MLVADQASKGLVLAWSASWDGQIGRRALRRLRRAVELRHQLRPVSARRDRGWVLVAIKVAAAILFAVWLARARSGSRRSRWACSIGGAIGNAVEDRGGLWGGVRFRVAARLRIPLVRVPASPMWRLLSAWACFFTMHFSAAPQIAALGHANGAPVKLSASRERARFENASKDGIEDVRPMREISLFPHSADARAARGRHRSVHAFASSRCASASPARAPRHRRAEPRRQAPISSKAPCRFLG